MTMTPDITPDSNLIFRKGQPIYIIEGDYIEVRYCESDHEKIPFELRTYYYPPCRSKTICPVWGNEFNSTWFDSLLPAKNKVVSQLEDKLTKLKVWALETEARLIEIKAIKESQWGK